MHPVRQALGQLLQLGSVAFLVPTAAHLHRIDPIMNYSIWIDRETLSIAIFIP